MPIKKPVPRPKGTISADEVRDLPKVPPKGNQGTDGKAKGLIEDTHESLVKAIEK